MTKKISYLIYKILIYLDKIFLILTKRSLLVWFKDFIENDSYKSLIILSNDVKFFVPNQIIDYRVKTFFTKEPETLEWINSFEKKENIIFWDIGANIGLYSIYNSLKNLNSTTIAFEPSSSNLRVLTRNISINSLEKNIKVFPMPLTNKKNVFQEMREGHFTEGGALNTFGEKFDFEGKEFESISKYSLFGTTINYLIENKILEIPDYIKIDVDGIEHLILKGGKDVISKSKSILIENSKNFAEQHDGINHLLKELNFSMIDEFIINKDYSNQIWENDKKTL